MINNYHKQVLCVRRYIKMLYFRILMYQGSVSEPCKNLLQRFLLTLYNKRACVVLLIMYNLYKVYMSFAITYHIKRKNKEKIMKISEQVHLIRKEFYVTI